MRGKFQNKSTSEVAQWLADWPHNPKVRGSKPRVPARRQVKGNQNTSRPDVVPCGSRWFPRNGDLRLMPDMIVVLDDVGFEYDYDWGP